MNQDTYLVTCKTTGCPNSFIKVEVLSETFPENVICGPCGNSIADIQLVAKEF